MTTGNASAVRRLVTNMVASILVKVNGMKNHQLQPCTMSSLLQPVKLHYA